MAQRGRGVHGSGVRGASYRAKSDSRLGVRLRGYVAISISVSDLAAFMQITVTNCAEPYQNRVAALLAGQLVKLVEQFSQLDQENGMMMNLLVGVNEDLVSSAEAIQDADRNAMALIIRQLMQRQIELIEAVKHTAELNSKAARTFLEVSAILSALRLR